MNMGNFLITNLKSCYRCKNGPVQILGSISLIFFQKNDLSIQNKNNLRLMDQIYLCISRAKL